MHFRDPLLLGPGKRQAHQCLCIHRVVLRVLAMRGEQSAGTVPPIPEPRLIAHVVSERAINAPNTIWASIPKSQTDPSIGFENITFARLNYAITRAARWMQDRLDLQGSLASRALAYVGPPDTRYIILTIAAIKTGSKVGLFGSGAVPRVRCNAQITF